MKQLITCFLFLSICSCIPVSIAPNIETDKLIKAKQFKRDLPDDYAFIFEDPKDADEFYRFIDAKYHRKSTDVESNVPITVDKNTYFLSFYEREKTTKTVNLVPVLVDAKRESNGNDPILEELHTSRTGQWYLVLTVNDNDFKDGLHPSYEARDSIIEYLRKLREEYLSTHNYIETYLKGEH